MAKEQIKEGTGVKDQHIIDTNESRRAFLKTAGIGVALFALAPANAFASVGGTTISPAGGG